MCGIVGVYHYRDTQTSIDLDDLTRVRDYMAARGPDGFGLWQDEHHAVGLAHRRLAIIDPGPAANQPMVRDNLVITFNGEIYNYRALKTALLERGVAFKTDSDTEVILALYQLKGKDMLKDLRGMFSLCIWDSQQRSMLLARDPYGIKPLYYCSQKGVLTFASQVKALLQSKNVSTTTRPAAECAFMLTGSVPEPMTWFEDIQALPAGAYIEINENGCSEVRHYWTIGDALSDGLHGGSKRNDECDFKTAIYDSVEAHLVADVEVGVFLSSGIDSGAIAAVASQLAPNQLHAVTLGFEEYRGSHNDEGILAQQLAEDLGVKHTLTTIKKTDFDEQLTQFIQAMDQPTIDGLNTWFISKAAHSAGLKVMLSGLGGDELLGGYPSFTDIPTRLARFSWLGHSKVLQSLANWAVNNLHGLPVNPKAWAVPSFCARLPHAYFLNRGLFLPAELPQLIGGERTRQGLSDFAVHAWLENHDPGNQFSSFSRIQALESCLYMRNQLLRDTDWASMAHSLEIRTPLVDSKLFETTIPCLKNHTGTSQKEVLAQAPTPALPEAISKRAKTGFTTPIGQWITEGEELSAWREQPRLRAGHCHWARRYAYSIREAYQS